MRYIFAVRGCSISVRYIATVGECSVKPSLVGFRSPLVQTGLRTNYNPNLHSALTPIPTSIKNEAARLRAVGPPRLMGVPGEGLRYRPAEGELGIGIR